MSKKQTVEAGTSLPPPLGSPVDSVPAFMREGHYVIFGIPENPDGTGNVRRGVALVSQSSALHWSGFTMTETGQIIGSIGGPWKRDEVLFGYPATLAEVWSVANTGRD